MPKFSEIRKPLEVCETCEVNTDVRYSKVGGDSRATRCADCAAGDAENWVCRVSKRVCERAGCTKRPRYYHHRTVDSPSLPTVSRVYPSRCGDHKLPTDAVKKSNVCQYYSEEGGETCDAAPSYANPKSAFPKSAKYCKKHAPSNFEYVNRATKCRYHEEDEGGGSPVSCGRTAMVFPIDSVGLPRSQQTGYCSLHRPREQQIAVGYYHVSDPRCEVCKIPVAVWKRVGDRIPSRCDDHRPDTEDLKNFTRVKKREPKNSCAPTPAAHSPLSPLNRKNASSSVLFDEPI